ncbi:MAG TPA: NAD(P)/FAD-dependent oxidoreductase [Candidatus Acidoferrum sp.]|nr:NAD(P)/FAD-dependent oxidoreductase [Candidatus Acidoferrum sp.]
MTAQTYDVAVVGAGLGGLATASLLAKAGRSVILLDRAPRAGGVCQGLIREGYRFELGGALLGGFTAGGPLARLQERLGLSLPTQACEPGLQVASPTHRFSLFGDPDRLWSEVRREFPEDETGWRALLSELDTLARERDQVAAELPPLPPVGWSEKLRVWRALTVRALLRARAYAGGRLQKAQATPFRSTMQHHGLGRASQQVLEACLWYLLLRNPGECGTLEAAVALQRVRQGVVAVPGGTTALVESLVAQFQRDGGQLRLDTPVTQCLVEHRRVAGVVLAAGETIHARWVVADVPPGVLMAGMLPPRSGWSRHRPVADGPWDATRVVQVMVLAVPAPLLPSELGAHCLILPDAKRAAQDANVLFVHTSPGWDQTQAPAGIRSLTVGRFVPPGGEAEGPLVASALFEGLDQVVPGIAGAAVYHELLPSAALAEMWGRPAAAVQYRTTPREWLGQRGLPHRMEWPGLLVVGEWTYPGRLLAGVAEGAMRVAELITASA